MTAPECEGQSGEGYRTMTKDELRVVRGGGYTLLTADPILINVVAKCAELETMVRRLRAQLRYEHDAPDHRGIRKDLLYIRRQIAAMRSIRPQTVEKE
jgi:hypothetical protein